MKIIFIMRDPIDRTWSSAARILGRQRGRKPTEIPHEELVEFIQDQDVLARIDYPGIVANWQAEFGADQMLNLFFDELTEQPASFLRRVFEFLEVDPSQAEKLASTTAVNAAAKGHAIPLELEKELARRLYPTIEAAAGRFGSYAGEWKARATRLL